MASGDVVFRGVDAEQAVNADRAEKALTAARPVFQTDGGAIDLALTLISSDGRLRQLDETTVADLAVSIAEVGLSHPITVRPVKGGFQLVVGAHRLAAFGQLGRKTIPAQVRQLSDIEARQAEIDENLVRSNLRGLDRLIHMAERVEIWAERNPDKIVMDANQPIKLRGRPPKAFLKLRKVDGYVPALMGFVADTARDTGLSKQSIYRATATMAGLSAATRDSLRGSWVAQNDAALNQLSTIGDAAEQTAVVKVLLDGQTKNIAEARAIAAGTPIPVKAASNTTQRDFEKRWKAATATQRDEMLHWLSGQSLPRGWDVIRSGADG